MELPPAETETVKVSPELPVIDSDRGGVPSVVMAEGSAAAQADGASPMDVTSATANSAHLLIFTGPYIHVIPGTTVTGGKPKRSSRLTVAFR